MNDLSIFDSLFNDVFGNTGSHNYIHGPKINVYEEDDAYTLEMELPGRNESDVSIELNHNNLTISSNAEDAKEEKKNDKEDKKKKYLVKECVKTSFSRSISVPTDVDEESISASFKNGVLSVVMKKKEIATPKKIAIASK